VAAGTGVDVRVAVRLDVGVRVAVRLGVGVRVALGTGVPVCVALAGGGGVGVSDDAASVALGTGLVAVGSAPPATWPELGLTISGD
jgi:hypothetical protein